MFLVSCLGIDKWIGKNTAKAVEVENVGILLVLTKDAWFKVYGQQAFDKPAQRSAVLMVVTLTSASVLC